MSNDGLVELGNSFMAQWGGFKLDLRSWEELEKAGIRCTNDSLKEYKYEFTQDIFQGSLFTDTPRWKKSADCMSFSSGRIEIATVTFNIGTRGSNKTQYAPAWMLSKMICEYCLDMKEMDLQQTMNDTLG